MFEDKFYHTSWFQRKYKLYDHYPKTEKFFVSIGTCIARKVAPDKKVLKTYVEQISESLGLDYLNIELNDNNLQWQEHQLQKVRRFGLKPEFILVQMQRPYYYRNSTLYNLLGDKNIAKIGHPTPSKKLYKEGCAYMRDFVSMNQQDDLLFFNHMCYSSREFALLNSTVGKYPNVILDKWVDGDHQNHHDQIVHDRISSKIIPWLKSHLKY
jgi:hypothetical protein